MPSGAAPTVSQCCSATALPASRLFAPDPVVTATLGLRLITVDRPGYGRSSGQPERRFADWPADVSELMESLGVESFSIVAHSSGGPYALACAAAMRKSAGSSW